MSRLLDLRLLFRATAILEIAYFVIGLVPPSWVAPLTGWELNADGQWIVKLLAVSLGIQGAIAWSLRDAPPIAVARLLALYQVASATVDWVMWLVLAGDGVFGNLQARAGVVVAIASHYALGALLFAASRKETSS